MRLSGEMPSLYVIQRKEAVSMPQKNLFGNMKEMPRAACHIKRRKIQSLMLIKVNIISFVQF